VEVTSWLPLIVRSANLLTTIPFCRQSEAFNRERWEERKSKEVIRKGSIAKRNPVPARGLLLREKQLFRYFVLLR
jgi:hypothetical protein